MPTLPTRQLGRTGLQVTTLGFGAMELRGGRGRSVSDADAERTLNTVLDAGINYVDTSPDYGLSEERIGKFISQRRSEYFLASKCGCPVGVEPGADGRLPHVFTAENVIAGVEQSLRRLQTDYLDLVQFHHSPSRAQLEENGGLAALQELQRQGKVRFIGMSGTLPNLPEQLELGVFDVFQIPYSLLQRDHEMIIGQVAAADAGVVMRGGVARGGPARESGEFWDLWQQAEIDDLRGDMSRTEFVLRFTLSNPDLDTTIVGTSNADHVLENVNTLLKGPLPADLLAEGRRRTAPTGPATGSRVG